MAYNFIDYNCYSRDSSSFYAWNLTYLFKAFYILLQKLRTNIAKIHEQTFNATESIYLSQLQKGMLTTFFSLQQIIFVVKQLTYI